MGGLQYRPTFKQQYLENSESKRYHHSTCLKECSISFLMTPGLIDFAPAVLSRIFDFKVGGNFEISKIEVLKFSGT